MLDQGYHFNPILIAALWNWFVAAPVKHATSKGDAKYTHDIDKLWILVHGSVSKEGQKGYSITRGQRELMIIKMFLKSFKMGIYI